MTKCWLSDNNQAGVIESFNYTPVYLNDFLSIGGPCFVRMMGQVCPTENRLSKANHIDTEAVVLNLDQYIINDIVVSKVYNGRTSFDFEIHVVGVPFL